VRAKRRNVALLQVVKTVASSAEHDLEQVIRQVMSTTQSTLNCHRVSLFQVDNINQELVCKVSEDAKGFRIKISAGIVGHVATTGEALNITDAYLDPRFNQDFDRKTNYRTRTILCVPVRARNNQIVAAIQVSSIDATIIPSQCWFFNFIFDSRRSTSFAPRAATWCVPDMA
jgi:signal transduction protein with GAF and PtsI domain